jgi:hypothetical protein
MSMPEGPAAGGGGGLMRGKRGLVMGVANDHSIAWGIAKTLSEHGAELAFSYQGEAFGKRIAPLAQSLGDAPGHRLGRSAFRGHRKKMGRPRFRGP